MMTTEVTKKRASIFLLAVSIAVMIGLYSLAVQMNNVDRKQRVLDDAEAKITRSDMHIYRVIARAVAMDAEHGAVEVDVTGAVVWSNEYARDHYGLPEGALITETVIPRGIRSEHDDKFSAAMTRADDERALRSEPIVCRANTSDGLELTRIVLWETPFGAMAILRPQPEG